MKRETTTITVASGKGGVGKSVVAVNLAETLARIGHSVALVDADFGQGACALLLNEAPDATLFDVLSGSANLAQALHRTRSEMTLITAVAEPGQADRREQALFGKLDATMELLRTGHDFIIIDTPAGAEGPVRWALDRADLGLLVVVGEPTAIADAYRLAKLVWQSDPEYPLATVINFADSEEDAHSVAERFGYVTEHFTGRVPNYLGWVPFSAQVRHSVQEQTPASRLPGPVQNAFERLADVLAKGRDEAKTPSFAQN